MTGSCSVCVPAPTSTTTSVAAPLSAAELVRLRPSENLLAHVDDLYKIPLTELNCSFGVVNHNDTLTLKQVLKYQVRQHKADVTVMFAIRQPACVACREHGQQLAEFASQDRRMAVIGTVKETGVNDQAILQFYQDYFRGNSIYLDSKWNIYKALGGRKLSIKNAFIGFFRSQRRFKAKGIINGSMTKKSESFIRGGVLIFDKSGKLRFSLDATDFQELDLNLLKVAVEQTRRLYNSKKTSLSSVVSEGTADMSESESHH